MDYLNYGNKVQQQPPKIDKSWPRFDPHKIQDKVQLTEDDFKFGDLNKQKVSQPSIVPPSSPKKESLDGEIVQLFAIPLIVSSYKDDYSKELEWIHNVECGIKNENSNIRVKFNRQSTDTFILDRPELVNIRSFIETKIHEYVSVVMQSDDEMVITQSWLNKNKRGESHHEHVHPNSIISGVWYPQVNKELPPIEFKNKDQRDVMLSVKNYNQFNCSTFLLPLNKGELIIFPSNLQHSVPPNGNDTERISLSFNTWGKGNMGDIQSLTYLPFDRLM